MQRPGARRRGSPKTRGRRAPGQRRQGAALPAMWQNSSSRPSIRRGSARHGARPRSGSSWSRSRLPAVGRMAAVAFYGLRRSEVLGLRWSDIDLRVRTLTADQARVLVEYRVRIEEPKLPAGHRLDPHRRIAPYPVTALEGYASRLLAERTAARLTKLYRELATNGGPDGAGLSGFTRSLRAVRNCETPGTTTKIQTPWPPWKNKALACENLSALGGLEPPTF